MTDLDSMDHAPNVYHPNDPEDSATNDAQDWYLIHTKPRQEVLALTNLSRQSFECYMPMLKLEKIRQRKASLVIEPMFPRYLFIRLDTSRFGQSWSPIRSTFGVNQLVRFGGQPAKVGEQLVKQLFSREQEAVARPLFAQEKTS